jgi:hypothetical protein
MRPMKRTGSQFLGGGNRKWYLAAGAPVPVAMYQPKGAASLAASYVNLVNPGTYNAAPGTAPTFDTTTGWTFDGTTQYLTTGVVPANDQTWSMIVRFSNGTNTGAIAGVSNGANQRFRLYRSLSATSKAGYANGPDTAGTAAHVAVGVLCVAGNVGYLNGASDKSGLVGWTGGSSGAIGIGASLAGATPSLFFAGNILALAIYNATLTAPQVLAISTAMAAL